MKEKNESPKARRWIKCSIEEEFLGEDRKAGKIERKRVTAKDRSKYKKTDQEKYLKTLEKNKEAKASKQQWLEGRVLSILPQGIIVQNDQHIYKCVLKGVLKKDKTQAKNLVAVGDYVLFEKIAANEGIIGHVNPRRTILSRADNLSRRKEQLIAVNIDQVMITVSVVHPPLKCSIIDRYIIASHKGGMEPILLINKIDLLQNPGQEFDPQFIADEIEYYQEALRAYAAANIPVVSISTIEGTGIEELKNVMRDKTSVFSGQSGVGKSSLINVVASLQLPVGEIVEKTKKGAHTTSTTHLLPLSCGGWCVDTPGIKSFGVWNLKKDEVESYFSEIHAYGLNCKFTDCTHTTEDECAVIQALEEDKLSFIRYESYQNLIASIAQEHIRR